MQIGDFELYLFAAGGWRNDGGATFGVVPKVLWERQKPADDKNLNEAELEYRFAKEWLLEAFFGDRGIGGADLVWSKRY